MTAAHASMMWNADMRFYGEGPDWTRDGGDWPNRAASRFVDAGNFRWHVQVAGAGPVVLLLHGTGAATHSWRDVIAPLAKKFTVVAPDLPGHGFTTEDGETRLSLPTMAREVAALLRALDVQPAVVAAHSAGAAIAIHMCLKKMISPSAIVSFNGALQPLPGMSGTIFPSMAKMLFLNPLMPRLFAFQARSTASIDRLMTATGSTISARGVELYRRLIQTPGHCAGALNMMANWRLDDLVEDLPGLTQRLVLVVGEDDTTIKPSDAKLTAARAPHAEIIRWPGLGHLAHEEAPQQSAELIAALVRDASAHAGTTGVAHGSAGA